ncbi:helix-turn-helix transcriptional regulator, partial [Enterococcus faecalis]|nr:helix-turn-helix transcriptional regulator [Enterococcus faecalis]
MTNFHEQLKKKRKEKQITQEQIAEHLNVARQTVSKWESGKSIPDIENAQQLSTFLDISLNELLGNQNDLEETR